PLHAALPISTLMAPCTAISPSVVKKPCKPPVPRSRSWPRVPWAAPRCAVRGQGPVLDQRPAHDWRLDDSWRFCPCGGRHGGGPISRTVEDCALTLQAIAGHDPRDPYTAHRAVPDYRAGLTGDIKGRRIGVIKEAV